MPSDDRTDQAAGDRATVALVYHAIGEVKELMRAHFETVNAKLEHLRGIPEQVDRLEGRLSDVEARQAAQDQVIERLDTDDRQRGRDDRVWRRSHLPAILLGALSLAVAVAAAALAAVQAF